MHSASNFCSRRKAKICFGVAARPVRNDEGCEGVERERRKEAESAGGAHWIISAQEEQALVHEAIDAARRLELGATRR